MKVMLSLLPVCAISLGVQGRLVQLSDNWQDRTTVF